MVIGAMHAARAPVVRFFVGSGHSFVRGHSMRTMYRKTLGVCGYEWWGTAGKLNWLVLAPWPVS
jgi:hypothetical protein